jgi:hypothetical protein
VHAERHTRARGSKRALLGALVAGLLVAIALIAPGRAEAGIFTDEATLAGNLTGPGSGFVTSDDGNLSCTRTAGVNTPSPCSFEYSFSIFFPGPTPTLTATAAAGSSFTGWAVNPATAIVSGCTTSAQCEVDMDAANTVTVTANFVVLPNSFPLTVVKAGVGSGTVTSAPAGINCGVDCGESVLQGTVVTLTATPNTGSTFAGWSGAGCTGTGVCTVTVNAATTVTATFDAQVFPLTVTVNGPANSGGVSSNPAGIACPGTCTFNYVSGTNVTLTAQAAPGALFQGWSGAGCSGTGTCTVAMSQAQSVTATFAAATVQANVVGTRFTKNGPLFARRVLKVTVNAQQDLSRIVMRIRRNGVTIASRTVRNFDADTAVLNFNVRNGISAGRAQLQVVFTNTAGTQKTQTRGIRIPTL